MNARRRNHYDVTNRIRVSHPQDVQREIERLFGALHPEYAHQSLSRAFDRFAELYAGWLPGWRGCDTLYHDVQHSLDCTLTAARLIDGHERSVPPAQQLGARRAVLGVVIALFHDVGYVLRDEDAADSGAAFTLSHVERSAEALRRLLPEFGLGDDAPLAGRLVHFTGYEMPLDAIEVREPRDRMLGFLVASADLIAQTADRCYLEKCRDFLFPEFEACGLAGTPRGEGAKPLYRDREELLRTTPDFNQRIWSERLDGYFGGVHRYLGMHFSGRFGAPNPYIESIEANLARVRRALREDGIGSLSLKPEAIRAEALRRILARPARPRTPTPRKSSRRRQAHGASAAR